MFKRFFIVISLSLLSNLIFGQVDTTMILTNPQVEIEATAAINDMYNFNFKSAEKQFRWLKQKYHDHPMPYFLLGLSEWWKIMPNTDDTRYDERFLAYMDSSISIGKKRFDNDLYKIEAAFFIAAAYGFKGRLYSERESWRKATNAGRNALKYFEVSKGSQNLSVELLFGDGLYNYYAEWIPENYKFLKIVLAFFPDGDKALGIEQLREVAQNAFYTRTEAQLFLMRILSNEENRTAEALPIGRYLHTTYPANAYFHRYYARMLYISGKYKELEPVALGILARIDSAHVGYEATSGRYATFFLGQINNRPGRDMAKAKYYYERAVAFGEEIEAYETGYYLYSLLALAKSADKEGDVEASNKYMSTIKDKAKRSHPAHKRARAYLKERRKNRK